MNSPRRQKTPSESSVYHRYAQFYDHTFDRVFSRRVRQTIRSLDIPPGARVLELGVGTGTSLEAYPKHADVVATDLSEDMLRFAVEQKEQNDWQHITLQRMNAQQIEFDDEQFDFVTAFHVVTVVGDCRAMMAEMLRVLKPGGRLAIVNHFRSQRPLIAAFVDRLNPLTRHLGWRTDLPWTELLEGMPVELNKCYKTSPFSLFTVLIGTKSTEQPGEQ